MKRKTAAERAFAKWWTTYAGDTLPTMRERDAGLGMFRVGARLPSARELAKRMHFGAWGYAPNVHVPPSTVNSARQWLAAIRRWRRGR